MVSAIFPTLKDTIYLIEKIFQGTDGPITVTGPTRPSVLSACGRIQVIVDSSRKKHEFTHFVSIPIKVMRINNE